MATIHTFRRPTPPPRRGLMTCSTLAWVALAAGGLAAFLALMLPGLSGLSTLVGLAVSIGLYAGLYNRCRG